MRSRAIERRGSCGRLAPPWTGRAASASTCTASADGRRPASARCRCGRRSSRELSLPPVVEALTRLPSGLVLVGGPTGSGKTTTVAALVDVINRRDAKHIVTIEDPIEYEHPHRRASSSRSRSASTRPTFRRRCGRAVRQSPDVIVVGEMRDPETMRIALAAGETGHLVFSTLHTSDVTSTVSRVADAFPPERQPTIRQELSMALSAVMTQAAAAEGRAAGASRPSSC